MNSFREWRLEFIHIGRRVLVYDLLDSTSSRCLQFSGEEKHHGLVVLAHAQTAGRGQHGRRWLCEAGTGVMLSALVFPPRQLCRPAILTAWAAVSVCSLIEETTGLATQIKWPNDVLIEGRKVCGILIEQNRGVVAGIGLNLNQAPEEFVQADLPEAGSLRLFTGQQYDVEDMARRLIAELDRNYQKLTKGDWQGLEAYWRHRFGLLGEWVEIEGTKETYTGRLLSLNFDAVVLESEFGEQILVPESIKHIRPVRS